MGIRAYPLYANSNHSSEREGVKNLSPANCKSKIQTWHILKANIEKEYISISTMYPNPVRTCSIPKASPHQQQIIQFQRACLITFERNTTMLILHLKLFDKKHNVKKCICIILSITLVRKNKYKSFIRENVPNLHPQQPSSQSLNLAPFGKNSTNPIQNIQAPPPKWGVVGKERDISHCIMKKH